MKKFPELKDEQTVILCSEATTGHVLDLNFNLAKGEEQEVYLLCDSYDDAIKMATLILTERQNIECVIYGSNQRIIKYLTSK